MLKRLFLFVALFLVPVSASAQGVVSAAEPRAAEAGREIMRAGGSASDAAMAMMLALTVVEPQSSGIGGGGFLLHHDGKSGGMTTIDGREMAPASAGTTLFLTPEGKPMAFSAAFPGGISVGVPGNIRLMAAAHQRWGKLPWRRLFDPAIRLADKGFIVSDRLAASIAGISRLWGDFPEIRQLYSGRDGKPLRAGERMRNPALAKTLRAIARRGPDAFYSGAIGREIASAVAAARHNPAQLTLADLAAYQARERPPVCSSYRRFKICGMGPPSSGATTVLQMLGMLERFDLKAMGPRDPKSWHLIAEAMKLAYADREKWLGDRDFIAVPVAGLLDPAYLRARSALISPDRPLGAYKPGTPPGSAPRTAAPSGEVPSTTHFVAVDRNGNVANMTSTVEGPFGSQLIAGGFVLNNELTDFSFAPEKEGAPVANRVQAGKRPLSSMSPTIVYDASGKPILALGSAGGKRIIMHVAKTLIGFLDFGLPAQQAIALPNLYFSGPTTLVEQGTFLAEMTSQLSRVDGVVTPAALGSKVNAAERTPTGWRGAADPRGDGVALSE
ncbi:gamma-glutamyltransferase [Sphingomonas sp.]|uniref:gamma-glutamyltransferase n=1 Tax=Sphingomonas sp. TaxID=28214 RepID=UPI002FCB6B87